MVEQALVERFFPDEERQRQRQRVVESWRLLERGYVHDEFVGVTKFQRSAETSQCKQHCHSYVPGLSIREFWDIDDTCFATGPSGKNWCQFLQSKYPQILREFQQVTANLDQLKAKGNNIWAGALTDDASSYGEGWKTLVLMDRGHWDPVNVNLFPVAAKAVHDSGVPAVEVFFASMQPHSQIQMHTDFTNFVLTSHLALDIPYSGQNKCRIRVGDEVRQWINGQVMVFDTSLLHDAANESDKTRYILMVRLWHPDLSSQEREALQFTYDCLEMPELLSPDPQERLRAQELALQLRSFPEVVKGQSVQQGFGAGGKSGASPKGKRSKGRR
jgi:Aspartyl/Asparaginyl beta-hydroxylase